MVRTKAIAILLGPSGVGLLGVYTSITWVASTLTGMGLSNSGVRQIAEAAGSGDQTHIARVAMTLNRVTWLLGLTGGLLVAAFSYPIGLLTFGNTEHTVAVALLGLSVFCGAVTGGRMAFIQGMRRIGNLAAVNALSGVLGILITLPFVFYWGISGIIPMLVVSAGVTLLISSWFARKVKIVPLSLSWADSKREARALLGLGMAFMASGLMNALLPYLTRILVLRSAGLDGAGHYAAAYTLSAIYAGFILQAMGADFFPRLTGVAKDNAQCNRMVNEQAEISLLLALPGLLATLALAPWVIRVFYAGNFEPAIAILRWQSLGMLCRVSSWPMGYILLAKGDRRTFLWSEIVMNLAHVLLLFGGLRIFGLAGAGIAFFAGNVFYWVLIFLITRRVSGFRWSSTNVHLASWMLPAVALAFIAPVYLPVAWTEVGGGFITLVCSYLCLRSLVRKAPENRIARLFRFIS